jgi:hypothetical protein
VAGGSKVLVLTDSHACWFNQPTFQTPILYPSSGFRTIMMAIRVGLCNAGRFNHHKRLPAQEIFIEFCHRGRFMTYTVFFSTGGLTTARPDDVNQETSR